MYIVSRCLLGENCKYSGGNNLNADVVKFCESHDFVTVCPEVDGGLPCPRHPAERQGDKVVNIIGEDVTEAFVKGSVISLEKAEAAAAGKNCEIKMAVLKAKSPSCGQGKIHDGTFSGTLTEGNGVFTDLLIEKGIRVISEKEMAEYMNSKE